MRVKTVEYCGSGARVRLAFMIECMEMSRDLHQTPLCTGQSRRQRTRQNLPYELHSKYNRIVTE